MLPVLIDLLSPAGRQNRDMPARIGLGVNFARMRVNFFLFKLPANAVLSLILCCVFPLALLADENGYRVTYGGGSLPNVKAGSDMRIQIDTEQVGLWKDKSALIMIPVSSIREVSYGQDVHRRVATSVGLAVLSMGMTSLHGSSKKHFIGLTWNDSGRKGGMALQAKKDNYRGIIVGLEGVTGKKALNLDAADVKK